MGLVSWYLCIICVEEPNEILCCETAQSKSQNGALSFFSPSEVSIISFHVFAGIP
jgi:hypothetical protein